MLNQKGFYLWLESISTMKISYVLILIILMSCMGKSENHNKVIIYQIFTRLFANQNTTNKFNGTLDENGCTKFKDINQNALKSIKQLGITHVWYTGVIEHGTMTDYSLNGIKRDNPYIVKGIAGSPYAIKDYYDVDPDLAENVQNRMKEFESLVERTHKNDLKVIIDFVPNHLFRQYHSDQLPKGESNFGDEDNIKEAFSPNNNFYYLPNDKLHIPVEINPPLKYSSPYEEYPAKVTGNDNFTSYPTINDWYETIKLNYGVDYVDDKKTYFNPIPDTWLKMRDVLSFWTKKGVDGFRCDMAEMVPVEFWAWVIPEIKNINKEVIFIAEIYNPDQYNTYLKTGKFDYLYDKVGVYDALRRLIEGHGNAEDISNVWKSQLGDFSDQMLRFLENHDEQRIASKQFAGSAERAFPAMALAATLNSGPVMIYFGQEFGVNPQKAEGFQGDDGRTTIFDYWGIEELQNWINGGKFNTKSLNDHQVYIRNFYVNLNKFINDHSVISNGKFHDLNYLTTNTDRSKVFTYLRYDKKEKLLFVFNFDQHHNQHLNLNISSLRSENVISTVSSTLKDVFWKSNKELKVDENGEINLEIPVNSFNIYQIQ